MKGFFYKNIRYHEERNKNILQEQSWKGVIYRVILL